MKCGKETAAKINKTLEGLTEREIRTLAGEAIINLRYSLMDTITYVATLKKRDQEHHFQVPLRSYEKTKAQLKRYNLWDPNYDAMLEEAKTTFSTSLSLAATRTFNVPLTFA